MKKISLLLMMLLTYSINVMAQNSVPVPADPEPSEWYDYTPYQWPNGDITVASAWLYIDNWGTDIMGNQVANDYSFELDSCFNDELLYTILDKDNFSYSIYTDFGRLFVFNPEEYPEFTEPTTNIYPYTLLYDDYNDLDTYQPTQNIEFWGPHFPNRTTNVEGLDMKPFPYWRIGVQTHYTVDGVTSSSNIVYLEVGPKPEITGDLNNDGVVDIDDVNICINLILSKDYDIFGDLTEDGNIDVADMNAIINVILNSSNN